MTQAPLGTDLDSDERAASSVTLEDFLRALFQDAVCPNALLVVWALNEPRTAARDIPTAIEKVRKLASSKDVYFCAGLRSPTGVPGRSHGKAEDVVALGGFWIDIDFGQVGHKRKNYPGTEAEALAELREALPIEPSAVLRTGGGVHVWYFFREVWTLEGAEERDQAQALLSGLQARLRWFMKRNGWALDSTDNLAFSLRPPETSNWKTGTPRTVGVVAWNPSKRYNPSDFEEWAEQRDAAATSKSRGGTPQNPSRSVQQLLEEAMGDEGFRSAWENKKDWGDASSSGVAATLASRGLMLGWSDAETAAVIAEHRSLHGMPPKDERWMRLTIESARKWNSKRTRTDDSNCASDTLPRGRRYEYRWYSPGELPMHSPDADIVRDLFGPGELLCLAGASGSGKSFIALDLAVAVAGNRPSFLGMPVQHHGPVLYLVGEGFRGLRVRLLAADPEGHASSRLLLCDSVPALLEAKSMATLLSSARELIRNRLHGEAPLLMILDTFAQAVAGVDENDNGAMGSAAASAADFAREFGCAVLLVHHSRKDRKQDQTFLRGAGSLLCALDAAWGIERVKGSANELVRTLTTEKQKDRRSDRVWRLDLESIQVADACTLRVRQAVELSSLQKERMDVNKATALRRVRRDQILESLQVGSLGTGDILEALVRRGHSPSQRTVRDDLNKLRAEELVDVQGETNNRRYLLTSKGMAIVRGNQGRDGCDLDPALHGKEDGQPADETTVHQRPPTHTGNNSGKGKRVSSPKPRKEKAAKPASADNIGKNSGDDTAGRRHRRQAPSSSGGAAPP